MFWRTVSEENSAPCWNRMPQRRSTARRCVRSRGIEIDAEHFDAAADLGHETDDGARQDRLARAGRADKAQDLAALDVEIEPVEHAGRAELHGDVADADDGVGGLRRHRYIPIDAKKIANTPSITMTKKIPFTTEAVVCWPSDSALPCTASPSTQATMPDHRRHDRRLDHADGEVIDRDRIAQSQQERFRIDAAIEPRHEAAAIERRHRAEEGQDRQRDHEREHARQDQDLDRVETHGAQRVDLLAHLHRAEFGGVRAARAARDHDRHQQHADFAQHQDAQHVDDEDVGAEPAEMEDALLRDDAADQKRNQHDDRHRAPAHLFEVVHGRGQAEIAGVHQDPRAGRENRAEHVDQTDKGIADAGHTAADLGQHAGDRQLRRLDEGRGLHPPHLIDQACVIGRQPGDPCLDRSLRETAAQPLDQPGPERVEFRNPRDIDHDVGAGASELLGVGDDLFKQRRERRGPRPLGA